jgi:uncharacterized protein (TIGR03435 family)
MKSAVIALWIISVTLQVQTNGIAFEVASIRSHTGEVTFSADPALRGSQVRGTASTLLDMIEVAYGVRPEQISGGPDWVRKDRFDLEAKVPGSTPPTPDQFRAMMQNLLAERFQLKVHPETKQVAIYALTVDRSGSKLKPSASRTMPTGFVRATAEGVHMETESGTMEKLAQQLSVTAGRPVVDKTGLNGTYKFTLDWFPADRIPSPDSTIPSMFAALQEQLGLKLESATGAQEVLIIDRVEKPTAN